MKLTALERLRRISRIYEDEWQETDKFFSNKPYWINNKLTHELLAVYCDLQHRGWDDKVVLRTLNRCMRRLRTMEKYLDMSHLPRARRKKK